MASEGVIPVDVGAVRSEHCREEKAVDTRVFMVELENALYIWVIEQLGKYRHKTGALSNSDALVKLLEENNRKSSIY